MRHLSKFIPAIAVTALFALVIGCGGGDGGPRIFSERQIVTPAGGVYLYRGGQISLTVPANAVTTNTPIEIQSPPSVAVPVDAGVLPDTTYQFTPTTFAASATLALGFDPSDLPSGVAETRLRVVRLSTSGTWVNQTATLDAQNDRLTLSTTTLGVFAIRIDGFPTTGSTATATTATASTATTATTSTTATTATTATTGGNVVAEAGLDGNGEPAVFVSWDAFGFGSFQRERWQVFRNDVTASPVLVATGASAEVGDTQAERAFAWSDFGGAVGGDACVNRTPDNANAEGVPGIQVGQAYQYSVQLVYSRGENELPGGTTGTARCYFASSRQGSSTATPINRLLAASPADGTPVSGPVTFSFESVSTGGFTAEYVVQVSGSSQFESPTTVARLETAQTGTLSTAPIGVGAIAPGTTTLFWRVGARNAADNPGPRPDALTGDRYVFSVPRTLSR
jgi:hypothetical protein